LRKIAREKTQTYELLFSVSIFFQNRLWPASGTSRDRAFKALGRASLKIHRLIAILLLVVEAHFGRPDERVMKSGGFGRAHLTLANSDCGTNAQILASGRRFKINIDGFNIRRDIEIAKDSRKLFSLAIALNAELDRSRGNNPSSAAVSKARAIQKLTRDEDERCR
jgi:hypothetical protein